MLINFSHFLTLLLYTSPWLQCDQKVKLGPMFRDISFLMNIARCGEVSPAPSFAWRVGIEAGEAVSLVRDILFFLIVA